MYGCSSLLVSYMWMYGIGKNMNLIISLFAITPLQVLAIQRKKKKKKKKKKKEQSRNTLQSTRPQNYVKCKLTEDTSLHCQMLNERMISFILRPLNSVTFTFSVPWTHFDLQNRSTRGVAAAFSLTRGRQIWR